MKTIAAPSPPSTFPPVVLPQCSPGQRKTPESTHKKTGGGRGGGEPVFGSGRYKREKKEEKGRPGEKKEKGGGVKRVAKVFFARSFCFGAFRARPEREETSD